MFNAQFDTKKITLVDIVCSVLKEPTPNPVTAIKERPEKKKCEAVRMRHWNLYIFKHDRGAKN